LLRDADGRLTQILNYLFNLFIKQKDRSATYIDMHEIHDNLKYTMYIKYKTQCEYA